MVFTTLFTCPHKLFASKQIGSSIGIINTGGTLGGFLAPLILGFIIKSVSSFVEQGISADLAVVQSQKRHVKERMDRMDTRKKNWYYESLSENTKQGLYNRVANAFLEKSEELKKLAAASYLDIIFPLVFSDKTTGSTDVGEVSWVVPTAQIMLACEPQGTLPHFWQWCANGMSNPAHKGMLAASRVIATTALDILLDDELLQKVKEEHKVRFANMPYEFGIPKDVTPK